MKYSLLTTLLLSNLLGSSAFALTQKIDLNLNETHLRQGQSLPLKRMMNRNLGARSIRGWKIKEVIVKAKSKHGQGEISLQVGHQESLSKLVPGTPENFDQYGLGHSTISLKAPNSYRGELERRVKLNTLGNIKLHSADILLKKQVNYDPQILPPHILKKAVEFKADKLIGTTKTIRPLNRVKGIVLEGTKRKVSVNKVEIHYVDGQVIEIDELDGKLRNGHQKVFALKGQLAKPISKIKVSASSNSLFGSRGKMALLLAQ